MIISIWILLAVAVGLAVLIALLSIPRIKKSDFYDSSEFFFKYIWVIMIVGLAFVFGWVFYLSSPKVHVITATGNNGDGPSYNHEEVLAWFNYKGHPVSFRKEYLMNETDKEIAVIGTMYYENPYEYQFSAPENDSEIYPPHSFSLFKHVPEYYFDPPYSVKSKDKSSMAKVRWLNVVDEDTTGVGSNAETVDFITE